MIRILKYTWLPVVVAIAHSVNPKLFIALLGFAIAGILGVIGAFIWDAGRDD